MSINLKIYFCGGLNEGVMAPRSKKSALLATVFFGDRKSRECSQKIRDFRENGIPVWERGEKVDTLTVYDRAFRAIIIILNYCG